MINVMINLRFAVVFILYIYIIKRPKLSNAPASLVVCIRQYTTEEGHRSVRKHWSFYYRFIGLKCHNYALYLCFVYEESNTRKPSYATLSHIMKHTYICIYMYIYTKYFFYDWG